MDDQKGICSDATKIAMIICAVIAFRLALPQLALVDSFHSQSLRSDLRSEVSTAGVRCLEGMGSPAAAPIQSINGKKIPGAPNGTFAEMAESVHSS
jgi:hypothetical protein